MDNNDICKNWSSWLKKSRFSHLSEEQKEQTLRWLLALRDVILEKADIKKGDKIIDIGTGTGLLGFGVIEKFQDSVDLIFSDKFQDCLLECEQLLKECNIPHKASFLISDCLDIKLPDKNVDKALMRSVLVHILDKQKAIDEIYRILKPGGVFCAFEPIINSNTRYHELVDPGQITDFEEFKCAEDDFMTEGMSQNRVRVLDFVSDESKRRSLMANRDNPLTNFDQTTLAQNLEYAGFTDGSVDVEVTESSYSVSENTVDGWFHAVPSPGEPSVRERFLKYFDENKVNNYISEMKKALDGKTVTVRSNTVFIRAVK